MLLPGAWVKIKALPHLGYLKIVQVPAKGLTNTIPSIRGLGFAELPAWMGNFNPIPFRDEDVVPADLATTALLLHMVEHPEKHEEQYLKGGLFEALVNEVWNLAERVGMCEMNRDTILRATSEEDLVKEILRRAHFHNEDDAFWYQGKLARIRQLWRDIAGIHEEIANMAA